MTTPTLAPPRPSASLHRAASPNAPGIVFRETMSGPFALGATEPDEGARAGEAAGTSLRLRVSIRIADLDAFLADREHVGGIEGVVHFPPLGTQLRAERGEFRLFARAPGSDAEPGHRLMIYQATLMHDGEPWFLDGRKLVMGGTPWRIWPETSTLFATLHRGDGPDAPVAGAGVLRLGSLSFLRILPTLRAPGAATVRERAATLLRFGRFFGDELWNAYVQGRGVHGAGT